MKKKFFIVIFIFLSFLGFGQTKLKEMNSILGRIPNLSQKAEDEIHRRDLLMELEELTAAQQKSLDQLLEKYPETLGNIWDIVDDGCNWYESGGAYEVTASSFLQSSGITTYKPGNAGDLSFATAWVEGAKGNGIGEYLEYYFTNQSPRVNKVMVFNGYLKTDKAWKENGRVKKLELSINGEPYAILNLKDSKAEQAFEVPPLGHRSDKKDLILKFKILEVYPGSQYEDVAITQIYFDGLDVHCFAKGTQITMADKSMKNIEDVAIGDSILTYNLENKSVTILPILSLTTAVHGQLVQYLFDNGTVITATDDHPFLLDKKGWSSLNPKKSQQYNGFYEVDRLEVGDFFKILDDKNQIRTIRLTSITKLKGQQETYTITDLGVENIGFIANGFIVGVEGLNQEI